jgi:hypothetical protein
MKFAWLCGCVAVLGSGIAWGGVTGNGALSSLNNGASRDFTNGASVTYGNGASTSYPNGARIGFPNGASVSFGNGASIGFGNGASVGFPNGAPATFASGGALVLPDGGTLTYLATVTLIANGTTVTYNANTAVTYTEGANLQFINGASIRFPNGASVNFPNGASVGFPNGASVGFPNGATVNLPNGASVSYPNGATVVVGGFNTQAFLTSKLWMYPIGSYKLDPYNWDKIGISGNPSNSVYNYLVGALKLQHGDLPPGSRAQDGWNNGEYDAYDLIAFKYLVRAAAKDTTVFTVKYTRTNGAVVSESFQGGLGLCETGTSGDWVAPVNDKDQLPGGAPPFSYLAAGCGQWISAAIGLFTQPVGINNSISIRNLAIGDHPAITSLTQITDSKAPALALGSVIRPLPRKRGVAIDPFAALDTRALEAMAMAPTGNSGAFAATQNAQGGWAGGYAFRCTGGQPVVLNFNKLKTATAGIPGTAIQQKSANLVLRVCKGVHGCNNTDADWLVQQDDYSATDVWPSISFTCGAGYSSVASADYSKYQFVYNWLVRSKDGNNAVSTGIADLCSTATETVCRSTTANPVAATANTLPASEAQIYTQREGLYFGQSFPDNYWSGGGLDRWVLLNASFGSWAPQQLTNRPVSVLFGNCDVRSVEPTLFGPGLPEPARVSWAPNAASFPSMAWPSSYRVLAHRPVSPDRLQYRREFCSSLVQDTCVPCIQAATNSATSTEGYLPMVLNGHWQPMSYTHEPWLAVAKDPSWFEQPQLTNEAVPVEAGYYNTSRVCAQQFDRGKQGYCFTDWQDASSCSLIGGAFTCRSSRYRDAAGPLGSKYVLTIWVPQAIQPTTPTNANRCPVGYAKGTAAGYTARCFARQANGATCGVDDECTSNKCECIGASCAARQCTAANAPVCKYCTDTTCTAFGNLALSIKDPQECESALGCNGAGGCL